jgi:hypothetical protein
MRVGGCTRVGVGARRPAYVPSRPRASGNGGRPGGVRGYIAAGKKKRLEDELVHADLGIEKRCELEKRVLHLRRRLSRWAEVQE